MPVFTIKTDQGEFDIEANRAPTNEEAMAAIAQMGSGAKTTGPATPAAPARAPAYSGMSEMGMGGLTHEEIMAAGKTTKAMSTRALPVAAAMAFPPAGIGGWASFGTLAAAAETHARKTEGKTTSGPDARAEAAKAFVSSAIPSPNILPAIKTVGDKIAPSVKMLAGQTAKSAAFTGGTAAGAEYVGRAIAGIPAAGAKSIRVVEDNEPATTSNFVKSLNDAKLSTAVGGVLGLFGSGLGAAGKYSSRFASHQQDIKDLGITKPTLATQHPNRAALETSVSAGNPVLEQAQAQVQSDIASTFKKVIGETTAASNSAVNSEVAPIVSAFDNAETAYQTANAAAEKAKAAYAAALKSPQLQPEQLTQIRGEVTAALLNADNARSLESFKRNALVGDAVPNSVKVAELAKSVKGVLDTRSLIRNSKYEAAGIPTNLPIFDKEGIMLAAENALGGVGIQKSLTQRQVLAAIAEQEKDGVAMTLDQIHDIKNQIATKFASNQQGTQSAQETMYSEVYDALRKHMDEAVAARFPDKIEAWREANRFTAETSQIQDSPFGRALLQRAGLNRADPTAAAVMADNTITTLANNMVKSNLAELHNFKSFVKAIEGYHPETAKEAMQGMSDALKHAFLNKHATPNGLNQAGLLDDLIQASRRGKLPFPVESLGFGDLPTLRAWKEKLHVFKPEEVNAVTHEVLARPDVQRTLQLGGGGVGDPLAKATAEAIFARRVRSQVALEYGQRTAAAKDEAKSALELARTHGIESEKAKAIYENVRKDPTLSAFAGRGNYDFKHHAGKVGAGTISDFLDSQPTHVAAKLMGALRENNPQVGKLAESRILANAFKDFVKPNADLSGGAGKLDLTNLRAYFNATDADAPVRKLRVIIGAEKVAEVEKFVLKAARLSDETRLGGGNMEIDRLASATAATTAKVGLGATERAFNWLWKLQQKGRYHTMSKLFVEKEFAAALYSSKSGDIADVIKSLPVQKAYLLSQDKAFTDEQDKK